MKYAHSLFAEDMSSPLALRYRLILERGRLHEPELTEQEALVRALRELRFEQFNEEDDY